MKHTSTKSNGHAYHPTYQLRKDYKKIKSGLAGVKKDVKSTAYQSLKNFQTKTYDLQEQVTDYIAEKPFKSLGIAALTGFVIALIFRK